VISDRDEDLNKPYFGKNLDLNMLALTGGRERTEVEFRNLLLRSGWHMTRVVRIAETPMCVVEAIPAVAATTVVSKIRDRRANDAKKQKSHSE